jgi:hypothetical protein
MPQNFHWQQVIDHAETCRRLLGDKLEQLSFEERQAVTHCLIKKVIIIGEEIDIHFILPFESSFRLFIASRRSLRGLQAIFINCDWHICTKLKRSSHQGPFGHRPPFLTKRVISEERITLTPRVAQPSDRRATPCARADRPIMRRPLVAVAWPPRSSADRSASIQRAELR